MIFVALGTNENKTTTTSLCQYQRGLSIAFGPVTRFLKSRATIRTWPRQAAPSSSMATRWGRSNHSTTTTASNWLISSRRPVLGKIFFMIPFHWQILELV